MTFNMWHWRNSLLVGAKQVCSPEHSARLPHLIPPSLPPLSLSPSLSLSLPPSLSLPLSISLVCSWSQCLPNEPLRHCGVTQRHKHNRDH